MTDSKEWCDGDWRWWSSSRPFAGAESGSPGRALEAGKRGSPGRAVQAGIRGKRLSNAKTPDSTIKKTFNTNNSKRQTCVRIVLKKCSHGSCYKSNSNIMSMAINIMERQRGFAS